MSSTGYTGCLTVVFLLIHGQGGCCLRLVNLHVPPVILRGDPLWLNCTYDLEMDVLYAVKWYKNDTEFYRYIPRDTPSAQIYPMSGVYVDRSKSSEGHVYFSTSDLETEGKYRCEASAEAPSFQTIMGEEDLMVYVLPTEDPVIRNAQPRYELGETVNVTCKSSPSKPSANLYWLINRKEAPQEFVTTYPDSEYFDGLKISESGLTFDTTPDLFANDVFSLRCTSLIGQNYSLNSEELIIEQVQSSDPPSSPYPVSTTEEQMIIGGESSYRVEDTVDINCTAARSKSPLQLEWFINENKVQMPYLVKYPSTEDNQGLQTTVLGLKFKVNKRHFEDGEMRLKCTAIFSDTSNMTSVERIIGRNLRSSGLQATESRVHGNSTGTLGGCSVSRDALMTIFVTLIMMVTTWYTP